MNYKVITDRIEVRSLTENNKPRYIVKGTAMISNKKHTYEFTKQPDGSYKTLKEMFTPHCLESIKKQAMSRKIFIDTQHELVRDASIKSLMKGKLNPKEQKQMDNMLKGKRLPLAKITDITINDDRMDIETEFNPMFREVDSDHQKYFDAVWYSLENKYLNGISVNFGNFEVGEDEAGDKVIDDAEVLGFSFLDGAAEPDNNIYEVAIRALEEGINEGEKMKEEKEKLEAEKVKLEEEKKKVEEEKVAIEKKKTEDAEAEKKTELEKQEADQKKIQDDLVAKTEEAKKKSEEVTKLQDELNSVKGVVKPQTPPTQPGAGEKNYNEEFYKGNLKDITAKHDATMETISKGKQPLIDETMSGFGPLVFLQSKISPTAGMAKKDAEYIQEKRLLDRGGADIIVPK